MEKPVQAAVELRQELFVENPLHGDLGRGQGPFDDQEFRLLRPWWRFVRGEVPEPAGEGVQADGVVAWTLALRLLGRSLALYPSSGSCPRKRSPRHPERLERLESFS